MGDFLTLDDVRVKGKRVLLRLDVNSPIEGGVVSGAERLQASAASLGALVGAGAAVVVVAHQGRKGDEDYAPLAQHAEILARLTGARVSYVDDVAGPKALAAIDQVAPGTALVLENVRSLDEETRKVSIEEHGKAAFVQTLAKRCDLFVNEAFSASHRNQASLVGFAGLIPCVAGPYMRRELEALEKVSKDPARPAIAFLGGAKPEDSIDLMRARFSDGSLDQALVGGLVGELFLVARANELGAATMAILEKKGVMAHLDAAEKLLDAFDDRVITPMDVAVKGPEGRENVWVEDLPSKFPILDIGDETIAEFSRAIAEAGSVVVNGPAGAYENPAYERGTKSVLEAVASSDAFTLIGGGHTVAAIERFHMPHDRFGYVSLAGGALIQYLCGEELPAVKALKLSKQRFGAMKARNGPA